MHIKMRNYMHKNRKILCYVFIYCSKPESKMFNIRIIIRILYDIRYNAIHAFNTIDYYS